MGLITSRLLCEFILDSCLPHLRVPRFLFCSGWKSKQLWSSVSCRERRWWTETNYSEGRSHSVLVLPSTVTDSRGAHQLMFGFAVDTHFAFHSRPDPFGKMWLPWRLKRRTPLSVQGLFSRILTGGVHPVTLSSFELQDWENTVHQVLTEGSYSFWEQRSMQTNMHTPCLLQSHSPPVYTDWKQWAIFGTWTQAWFLHIVSEMRARPCHTHLLLFIILPSFSPV